MEQSTWAGEDDSGRQAKAARVTPSPAALSTQTGLRAGCPSHHLGLLAQVQLCRRDTSSSHITAGTPGTLILGLRDGVRHRQACEQSLLCMLAFWEVGWQD